MNYKEWASLRARLNHDWLQNKYMTFLLSFKDSQNSFDDTEDLLKQLLQWKIKRDLFLTLIGNAEDALSPKQLLEECPLNTMEREDREWLGNAIHLLFCIRTRIRDMVSLLLGLLDTSDKMIDGIVHTLEHSEHVENRERETAYCHFLELSAKISELPHKIILV